jgi:hypothetical protein
MSAGGTNECGGKNTAREVQASAGMRGVQGRGGMHAGQGTGEHRAYKRAWGGMNTAGAAAGARCPSSLIPLPIPPFFKKFFSII